MRQPEEAVLNAGCQRKTHTDMAQGASYGRMMYVNLARAAETCNQNQSERSPHRIQSLLCGEHRDSPTDENGCTEIPRRSLDLEGLTNSPEQ